jgi:hypothetical protein
VSITQFTSGIPLSMVDKCAIACRQILYANDRLKSWTEGRIQRAVILALPRAIGTPSIIVSTRAPRQVEDIGCAQVFAPIVLTAVWNEPLAFLEDHQGGGETALVEIERTILANSLLKVPQFGEDRLVERFVEFRPDGDAQFFEKGNSVVIFQSIIAEFEVSLNRITRERESGS